MQIKLLSSTPSPEKHIEFCGRVSHRTTENTGSHDGFIPAIIAMGHDSVLEHAYASFLISGISRVCSHQLVRHRLSSYTQESQRYVEESGQNMALVPSAEDLMERAGVREHITKGFQLYKKLLSEGVKKQDARYVLPQIVKTTLVMTSNFRQWRSFLKLRLDRHAQEEIRLLAKGILDNLIKIAPACFSDLVEKYEVFPQK